MLAVVTPRAPTGVKLLATSKTLGIRPGKGKEKSDEHNECEGKIPKLRISKKHGMKLGRSIRMRTYEALIMGTTYRKGVRNTQSSWSQWKKFEKGGAGKK